jgi:hypothetical protein
MKMKGKKREKKSIVLVHKLKRAEGEREREQFMKTE